MMKHLLTIVLCLTTLTGLAQEEKIKKSEWWNGNPSYAVPIREVNVTARRPMKEIGIQKTQLDTTILHENIALSMADILTFNTSIFVKQYGRATLSTVAFRGTSPSHTQVTWNGMRINSPMLGMTDFSMIPSYFIDDASLLHGTSSVNEAGRSSSPRALPMRTVSTCNTRRVSARFRLSTSFCASPTATTAGKLRHASSIPPRQTTSSTETTIKTCLSWTTTTTSSAPTTRSNATKAVHTTISTRCRKSITIPDTATVSDCRPGMSIRSGDFRCCRSITRRTTTT